MRTNWRGKTQRGREARRISCWDIITERRVADDTLSTAKLCGLSASAFLLVSVVRL
jgi:hypothetical protein